MRIFLFAMAMMLCSLIIAILGYRHARSHQVMQPGDMFVQAIMLISCLFIFAIAVMAIFLLVIGKL